MTRSSHRRCSVRKSVLRNFTKFTGKHLLCQSLCKWGSATGVFLWILQNFNKHLLYRTHLAAASVSHDIFLPIYCCCLNSLLSAKSMNRSSHRRCSIKKIILKILTKFTGKHLCESLFFNKVTVWGLQLY